MNNEESDRLKALETGMQRLKEDLEHARGSMEFVSKILASNGPQLEALKIISVSLSRVLAKHPAIAPAFAEELAKEVEADRTAHLMTPVPDEKLEHRYEVLRGLLPSELRQFD